MLSSQLLELNNILNEEQVSVVQQYVNGFTTNTKISLSKFSFDTNIDMSLCRKVIKLLQDRDILKANFGVRCPECNILLNYVDDLSDIDVFVNCYNCGADVEITQEDVEVIYTVKNLPFTEGQRSEKIWLPMSVVPTEDTLASYLQNNDYNLNKMFYSPSDEQLSELKQMYLDTFSANTSSKKGQSLEQLVTYLFNICKQFEATDGLRPRPNQIDCYVRNKLCSPGVPGVGSIKNFCIECKNESSTPEITYLNKLHSILKTTGIEFGIVVSKEPAPSTYPQLANKIYLNDKIIIISICKNDLHSIISDNVNLLDLIEMKINEVKLDATKPLKELGLYK